MKQFTLNNLLYSAKSTAQLFLPLRFLKENDCLQSFSILAEQGIAISCYLTKEDANSITDEPFIFAKLTKLASEGLNLFKLAKATDSPFYISIDNKVYTILDSTNGKLLLTSDELATINGISASDDSTDIHELIPQKWPDISYSLDKSIIKIGDTCTLNWQAIGFDRIQSKSLKTSKVSGEAVLAPKETTDLVVDFYIGQRFKRVVIRINVIQDINLRASVSVKNVLTNDFDVLTPLDIENPVYAIKRGSAIEISWDVDFADDVFFSPFGKVEKEGIKRFNLENPLDLVLKATLGTKSKESRITINCFPTPVDSSLIHTSEFLGFSDTDTLTITDLPEALAKVKQSFLARNKFLQNSIDESFNRLVKNKNELLSRLSKMNNFLQLNSKPKSTYRNETEVGGAKKYNYSSILNRFSRK